MSRLDHDTWTTIGAAVIIFLVVLPTALPPPPEVFDNYTISGIPFRLLLTIGPVGMVVLAFLNRRMSKSGVAQKPQSETGEKEAE